MKKNKLRIGVTAGIVLLLLLIFYLIFIFLKDKSTSSNDKVVVKENVYVISNEAEKSVTPIGIENDRIMFAEMPKYTEGDVIVCGITEYAPNGFIRKVVSVMQEGNNYVTVTEPAYLTDVFEEAHIKKTFVLLGDNKESDISKKNNILSGMLMCKGIPQWTINKLSYNENNSEIKSSETDNSKIDDTKVDNSETKDSQTNNSEKDKDNRYEVKFKEDHSEGIEIEGEITFTAILEIEIDIKDEEITLSMVKKYEADGKVFVGYQKNVQCSLKKELFSKSLPNIEFFAGTIPIVITNEISSEFDGNFSFEGQMGTSFGLKAKNIAGFKYSSKTNDITEIRETDYFSDGIEWETEASAKSDNSVGISLHLITKLYDVTGADISAGIEGNVKGEVGLDLINSNYVGSVDLVVEPKIQGSIVVSIPIIDEILTDTTLFEVQLPALWKEHWESSGDWKELLKALIKSTYTTRFSDVHAITVPQFQFDFPKNWTITKEEVYDGRGVFYEVVELTNERGVIIRYACFNNNIYNVGIGRDLMICELTKVGDSNLDLGYVQASDYSKQGKMVVAKVHDLTYGDITGQYMEEYDQYIYVVVPESYLEIDSYVGADEWRVKKFSFEYGGSQAFIAHSPDGKFTKKEEKEIIQILSSFREMNYLAE